MTKRHQTLCQSNITPKRTFKAWYKELRSLIATLSSEHLDDVLKLTLNDLDMYYSGGYSPKMTIQSYLRIPVEEDLFTSKNSTL